jgi:hypothetical protein
MRSPRYCRQAVTLRPGTPLADVVLDQHLSGVGHPAETTSAMPVRCLCLVTAWGAVEILGGGTQADSQHPMCTEEVDPCCKKVLMQRISSIHNSSWLPSQTWQQHSLTAPAFRTPPPHPHLGQLLLVCRLNLPRPLWPASAGPRSWTSGRLRQPAT